MPSRGCQWGLFGLCMGATLNLVLRMAANLGLSLPIKGVKIPVGDAGAFTVIAVEKEPGKEVDRTGLYNWSIGMVFLSAVQPVMLVDDDIDVSDNSDIFEAWHSQTNPARDWFIGDLTSNTCILSPYAEQDEQLAKFYSPGNFRAPNIVMDAVMREEPPQGVRRMTFESLYPEELQQWVIDKWPEWKMGEDPIWKKDWLELGKMY